MGLWVLMWQPSIAPMMPLMPQTLAKAAAEALFSQWLGQVMKEEVSEQRLRSSSRMDQETVDWETSNLSKSSQKEFWLPIYQRNISILLQRGTSGQPPTWWPWFIPCCSSMKTRKSNWAQVTQRWWQNVCSSISSKISHSVPVFRTLLLEGDCSKENL